MVEIAALKVAGIDLATGTEHAGHVDGLPVTLALAAPLVRLSLRADGVTRLGPDEWYALLPEGTPVPDAAGQLVSVVDVSARAVGFTVMGPGALAALMRGCPLDLAAFTPGRATRTLFETVEVQIWMLAPGEYHVEVWRSFAPWLWHSIAGGII